MPQLVRMHALEFSLPPRLSDKVIHCLRLERSPRTLTNLATINDVCSRLVRAFHWRNVGSADDKDGLIVAEDCTPNLPAH